MGRRAAFLPCEIRTSARIVVNAENFAAWCFYRRTFYAEKDINAPTKLDLNTPGAISDFTTDLVPSFFQRRAIKLACRDLIPLAICDRHGVIAERLGLFFGAAVEEQVRGFTTQLRWQPEWAISERFDLLIDQIEADPASAALSDAIEGMMQDEYAALVQAPVPASVG